MGKIPVVKHFKIILIAFLAGVSLFIIFKYILTLKEKYDLLNALNQTKEQLADLELEKQNLLQEVEKEKEIQKALAQENLGLQGDLRGAQEELIKLKTDFAQLAKTIEELNSQLGILTTENTALREEENRLKLELSQVSQEKDNLKARLNSVVELKKAIRELKIKMRQRIVSEVKEITKSKKIIVGNRGFLIKDGRPTYPAQVIIEVIPAPANK
jgi:chromosome segregation ATPase